MQAIIMLTRCVEMGKVSHNVFSKSIIISLNYYRKSVYSTGLVNYMTDILETGSL